MLFEKLDLSGLESWDAKAAKQVRSLLAEYHDLCHGWVDRTCFLRDLSVGCVSFKIEQLISTFISLLQFRCRQ